MSMYVHLLYVCAYVIIQYYVDIYIYTHTYLAIVVSCNCTVPPIRLRYLDPHTLIVYHHFPPWNLHCICRSKNSIRCIYPENLWFGGILTISINWLIRVKQLNVLLYPHDVSTHMIHHILMVKSAFFHQIFQVFHQIMFHPFSASQP